MAKRVVRKLKNDVEPAPLLPSFGDLLLGWAATGETAGTGEWEPGGTGSVTPQADAGLAVSSPAPYPGSAEIAAMVARTAPAILDLLKDGGPRSKSGIVTALAGTHPKDDVVRSLMRLAVTGGVEKRGSTYALGAAPEPAVD